MNGNDFKARSVAQEWLSKDILMTTLTPGEMPLPFLRYDGKMGFYYQFTEYDTARMSYGASFYVEIPTFTVEKLAAKREEKLDQFSRCALL